VALLLSLVKKRVRKLAKASPNMWLVVSRIRAKLIKLINMAVLLPIDEADAQPGSPGNAKCQLIITPDGLVFFMIDFRIHLKTNLI